MKKLNDLVHCTTEIFFVPGSKNSVALNTYAFDTLKINNEVVNAKELYMYLKKHYELALFDKDIKESLKHECHTKYKTQKDVEKHNDEVKHEYQVLNFDQYKELGRQRIDESKDSEWQCPTCKHRVKNLQRQQTKDGNPCWGCLKFCDTLDASYFNGKACKMYEEGYSGYIWL